MINIKREVKIIMNKRVLKNIGIIALAMAICLLPQVNALASVSTRDGITSFYKQPVDSNTFTCVCAAMSSKKSTKLEIQLSAIYKGNGSASNYKKVNVNPKMGTTFWGTKTASLTTPAVYSIPDKYQSAANIYYLYAKGNNPELDCQISGFLIAR